MKLGGEPRRLELTPETEEERRVCRAIMDGEATIYWGDAKQPGGALIINTAEVKKRPKPTTVA